MKKVQILIVMFLVASTALFSFRNTNTATKYGGTASVTVKVESVSLTSNPGCWSQWNSSGKKAGETRVLEVTTSCNHSNSTSAKEALKREIEYEIKCYEKLSSSIDYDIDTCE